MIELQRVQPPRWRPHEAFLAGVAVVAWLVLLPMLTFRMAL